VNDEVLRSAPAHVRAEYRRVRRLNGDLERALQEASEVVAAVIDGGEPPKLPGRPPRRVKESSGAQPGEWFEFFLARGAAGTP
jgi:hypothetical protein